MEESWFAEPPFGGFQQRFRVLRRLHAERTAWQSVEVLELESFGRTLVLDGVPQTSVSDEFTYHEPLVHVPLVAHPNPRQVLIIGGGDGGALRQVLLHRTVERAVLVEIDRGVVDVARKYLPEISGGAYEDPRVEVHFADGADFVAATDERFDVVLVDSTDPVGPAAPLIGDAFLSSAREVLSSPGLMVMQSGSPLTQPREWVATVTAFRHTFPVVRPYLGWVPLYPGVIWSWVAGSREIDPAVIDDITVSGRMGELRNQLRIYNSEVHRAAFALPTFVVNLAAYDCPHTAANLRGIGHPLPGVVPD